MEIFIVIILMLIGILFFLMEIFLFPGISIAGIAGCVFVVSSIYYAFTLLGAIAGAGVLLFGIVVLGLGIWMLFRSRTLEKISLHSEVEGKIDPLKNIAIQKGDLGITISRLAPIGTVEINGSKIEAKSLGEFIDPQTKIEVIDISENKITVRPIHI